MIQQRVLHPRARASGIQSYSSHTCTHIIIQYTIIRIYSHTVRNHSHIYVRASPFPFPSPLVHGTVRPVVLLGLSSVVEFPLHYITPRPNRTCRVHPHTHTHTRIHTHTHTLLPPVSFLLVFAHAFLLVLAYFPLLVLAFTPPLVLLSPPCSLASYFSSN